MKPRTQAILNTLSVIYVLFINYYSQVAGINGNTVGSLSRKYDNLFTPASYAFSIWGIIFLLLIVYVIHQWVSLRNQTFREGFKKRGPWFLLANAMNGLWVIVWLYEWTAISVLVMTVMLYALLRELLAVTSETAGWREKIFQNLPISIYTGWISVAIIANTAAFLSKLGWTGGPFSESTWTLIMIAIAIVVNLFVLITTKRGGYIWVGAWALFAISVRQEIANPDIGQFAWLGTWILLGSWALFTIWSIWRSRVVLKAA
ncbi:MAG: hypothetical protein R8G66_23190 [Cytophagales bacterium]|nr:hypothetical protein [Cytophagales bacterium]